MNAPLTDVVDSSLDSTGNQQLEGGSTMATLTYPTAPTARLAADYPTTHRSADQHENPAVHGPRRARAKRGDGDRLRDEILDAVDAILTRTSKEDAVSIRAVAEQVGCTPPAIYLHFFDKNELLFEVCSRRFRQLNKAIDEAVAGITDPVEALAAGTRAYVAFGLAQPEYYRILFMGKPILTPEQLDELRANGITGLSNLVDRCQACIDAGAVSMRNAKLMAFGIWAISHGVVSLMISRPNIEWPKVEVLLSHLLDTHLAGLRTAA
jgi:AcrR family transcriptional regulator